MLVLQSDLENFSTEKLRHFFFWRDAEIEPGTPSAAAALKSATHYPLRRGSHIIPSGHSEILYLVSVSIYR